MSENRLKFEISVGVCDYNPHQMILRAELLRKIRKLFIIYGGQEIDTPVFELKSLLMKKYGEEAKLIFDLADGKNSLRYDLTVPLVRYLIMNKIESGKFFRIGKVYRKDTPSMNKGRLREFYQCDFDFVGNAYLMFADAECIMLMAHVIRQLGIQNFIIK